MANQKVSLYSDVRAIPVEWLWYPYISIGKITLLQGDPGDGKSTMIMKLIAELTRGGCAPDGTKFGCPRRVIYQCSEDGVADTIKPRLIESGADCTRVAFLNEDAIGCITLDDEKLRDAIMEFRPYLLVIDPIQSYLGNDCDLQVAGKARKAMQRLGMWATTYGCAVILVGHMNKNEGKKNLYRGLGSIDVAATARSVLQIERDTEDTSIRHVLQIKNNLGPIGSEIVFRISTQTGFEWCLPIQRTVPCMETQLSNDEDETQMDKVARVLKEMLSDGAKPAQEIYEKLNLAGLSRRTIQNVKASTGIRSFRKMNKWYWTLNPEVENTKQLCVGGK